MKNDKLKIWADQLLDIGKRNNLINFKNTKRSSVEVLLPGFEEIYDKLTKDISFSLFLPKYQLEKGEIETKVEFLDKNQKELQKRDILVFSDRGDFRIAVKNIAKKARSFIEETGVNVAYMAFGFIHWTESSNSNYEYRTPLILVPIQLIQNSSIDPYKVRYTGDDVIINPTFSYKLVNEFGIELPELEDDSSISSYMDEVSGIVTKLGWTLTREVFISLFTFMKINMYKDLYTHERDILNNKNIRCLLGEEVDGTNESFSLDIIDDGIRNPLVELHNVIDADSSQIDAIRMAKAGKSFVLQGPPGTGKSQTITNIIAESLFDGKRVLFVSEKLAALNVVFNKLRDVGLSDSCLELHSHKANKKDVICELNRTMELPALSISESASDILQSEKAQCVKLDLYANELHKKHQSIDMSLYQLYEKYAKFIESPWVEFNIPEIESKGKVFLADAVRLLEQYVEYSKSFGDAYKNSPWYGFSVKEISYIVRTQIVDDMQDFAKIINQIIDLFVEVSDHYKMIGKSFEEACAIRDFLTFIGNNPCIVQPMYDITKRSELELIFGKLSKQSEDILSSKAKILSKYSSDVLQLDCELYEGQLKQKYSSSVKRFFSKSYRKLLNSIISCRTDKVRISYSEAISIVEDLKYYRESEKVFIELYNSISNNWYKGIETNWAIAEQAIKAFNILSDKVDTSFFQDMSCCDYENSRDTFKNLANELDGMLKIALPLKNKVSSYFDENLFDLNTLNYQNILSRISACLKNVDGMNEWYSIRENIDNLSHIGILGFVDSSIESRTKPNQLPSAFCRKFYFQWIDNIITKNEVFRDFSGINQDWIVKQFADADRKQFEINRGQIKSELSHRRPALTLVAAGSPVSILRREAQKKRRQKSVRSIFNDLGNLVQTLKPCFLMSPLSVSTYLDPASIHFDMVIFDEASQVFPQDALGAIYRADQLIVVGDTKQMPPSNFFSTTIDSDEEEDVDDVSSFESILDICATKFPQLRLNWHYRSRDEELIAFSNKNFYNNTLITFPSSNVKRKGLGVDYYYVSSFYDRSSRSNRGEAEKIVDLIYEHFRTSPDRSLGVVAFSTTQQDMIDNILSERRLHNPEFEPFFSENKTEPFFIKNLETVQGDERDTIIFSIGYGKEPNGRLLLNFGPLNKEGGERRLNVAVTRAKYNIKLVTGMHYTDIDLSRTKSEGIRLLREYLDFAENGVIALGRSINNSDIDSFDSDFEMEVCSVLRNHGFTVDTQVGCSGFKIDLGVRLPETSDYVLAIECDGATYHSSRNARDRDRLRQDVLEHMGWKFYRVWSTDWFKTRKRAEDNLLRAVNDAVNGALSLKNIEIFEDSFNNPDIDGEESSSFEIIEDENNPFPVFNEISFKRYKEAGKTVQEAILEMLLMDLPVSKECLVKAYAKEYGNSSRPTNDMRIHLDYYIQSVIPDNVNLSKGFFYPMDKSEIKFRMAKKGTTRDIKYISPEELAIGMKEIIKQNVSISRADLYRTIAGFCGIQRVGNKIKDILDIAFSYLAEDVICINEEVSLKSI